MVLLQTFTNILPDIDVPTTVLMVAKALTDHLAKKRKTMRVKIKINSAHSKRLLQTAKTVIFLEALVACYMAEPMEG
jgi:hypothetical protein